MALSTHARRRLEVALARSEEATEISDVIDATEADVAIISVPTTTATTLYVATTGDDDNDGSADAPFLTIQAALDSVPRLIRHPVIISVGAGTFDGFYVSGFQHQHGVSTAAEGAYLAVKGTLTAFTPATGTSTGTSTAGSAGTTSTFGTLTDSGQTWTVNNLAGKLLRITSGSPSTAFPNYRVIQSNTSTAITITGTFTGLTTGLTYEIMDWATIVNTTVDQPLLIEGSAALASTLGANVHVGPNMVHSGAAAILELKELNLAAGTRRILNHLGQGVVGFRGCSLTTSATTSTGVIFLNGGGLDVNYTNVASTGNNVFIGATRARGSRVTTSGSRFVGNGASNMLFSASAPADAHFFASRIESWTSVASIAGLSSAYVRDSQVATVTTGVSNGRNLWDGGAGTENNQPSYIKVQGTSWNTCTTVVDAQGGAFVKSGGGNTGTGNTTVWSASKGGRIAILSTDSVTGTNEVQVDGVNDTLANLRAATPKHLKNSNYFTVVWEP